MNLDELKEAPLIDQLLAKFGGHGTDKQTAHSYGPVYEYLLTPWIDQECTLLEIGVCFGGSLRLWYDLLPKATIIGIDREDFCKKSIANLDRCQLMIADAYQATTVYMIKELAPQGIDILIDDGPHTLASQQAFLIHYLPLLKPSGFAMIEDIQNESFISELMAIPDSSFLCKVIDRRWHKGRYDDLMLLIQKRMENDHAA